MRAGRPNEAVTIRATLKETYSQYPDLADLLGPPPQTSRPGTVAPRPSLPHAPRRRPPQTPPEAPEPQAPPASKASRFGMIPTSRRSKRNTSMIAPPAAVTLRPISLREIVKRSFNEFRNYG